jgi:hypothetical protein
MTSGREAAANESSALIKASQNFPGYCTSEKMTPDDFEILAVVGQGAFGKVRWESQQLANTLHIAHKKYLTLATKVRRSGLATKVRFLSRSFGRSYHAVFVYV